MDGGTGSAAELLSPGEAEWPPELRLPPPPPPQEPPAPAPPPHRNGPSPAPQPPPPQQQQPKKGPSPPRHTEGFDDQHFLGSIMGAAAPPQQQQPAAAAAAQAPVKRKRGRPPKNRDGAAAAPAPAPVKPVAKKDEEVVCFICFDGGNLVVCDRRGCPKVYHPACIKRDESFFRARGKWDCGWHICSSCQKAVQYMCYTCTYSLCKGCINQGNFFAVRGNKGFCDTCYGTILLIESKDEDGTKVKVDFDDKNSWEYLFKLYWLDLKGKHLLTLEELVNAKSRWPVHTTAARRVKAESSDELYDANNDQDSDSTSRKRRRNNSSGKRGRKRQTDGGITARKCHTSSKNAASLPKRVLSEGMALPGYKEWASPEMLEFIGHMRNGDQSHISQYDVQVLLLEYINQNSLRDPRNKNQIICDARLNNLFRKPRFGQHEMLKLLEMHFSAKESVNGDTQRTIDPDSSYNELTDKSSDKRRKTHKKIERELSVNPEDYAAIDMHNINLIYLRRSLMEDLIDDHAAFCDKISGAFVRIRISGLGQKQDMYRLVKVLGTHKVAERYNVGKKTTDYALEILNLDRKEVITMDTISNQDFTEEECKRLRQSMKFGLVTRLKVGEILEKAKIFQGLQVNDWLESEKQRLSHLRDRASETGRRKELRECVEKLQLLNTPEERARRINEVPEVHVDPHMDPNYESAEEQDYKKAVDWTMSRNGSDLLFTGRKGPQSNFVENRTQKHLDASCHTTKPPTEDVAHRSGSGSKVNLQSIDGEDTLQPCINLNNTAVEAASLSSSCVISDETEPEKVWLYKDPKGNVQGPFTLSQLSKWTSYFPRDLRVWLTFESEENSLLLTEVLPKQQEDCVQPTSVTSGDRSTWSGTRQDRINSTWGEHNLSSPIGYNMVYSSALSSQSADCSDPTSILAGTLPSGPSAGSYVPLSSSDEAVPREQIGDRNGCQDIGGMWSTTVSPMNHSCKSNVEPHPDWFTTKKELQNYPKSNSQAGSVENLSSQVPVLTAKQTEEDHGASLSNTTNPLESKAVCQQEGTSLSKVTNDSIHDDLELSIASAKLESYSPTEDRNSSSASGVPRQSGAPACIPLPVLSMSTSNLSKTEETLNQYKTCHSDALNVSINQPPEPKSDPVLFPTRDLECEYPSPTPKLERKEISMNQPGSTAVASEDSATNTSVHSSVSLAPEPSEAPAGKKCSLQSLEEKSCLEERYLRDTDSITQTVQQNQETASASRKNMMVNPVSDSEAAAVSDVLESLTEQNCEKYSIHGATPSEDFVPASAEEEQPQCSSPIALSPWGEPSYYQGEAVESAMWGVQDDPSSDMFLLSSPTPLQPSSGLGADGKHASCIIEEVIVARGNSAVVETLPSQGEKTMEQGNSAASTGSPVWEQAKPKSSAMSGPALDGSTKVSGWQPSITTLERSAKASDWKLSDISLEGSRKASGSSLEGGVKVSSWQPSGTSTEGSEKTSSLQRSSPEGGGKGWPLQGSSAEGSTKASAWQRSSSSPEGSRKVSAWQQSDSKQQSTKASGWQRSSSSPEGSRKASAWQQSDSTQQSTKASGWQPSASSKEGSAKASGWQRSSSSPEGSRKASGWHSSVRESSKVHSGANENRKSSSNHQTPTAKYSSEAPKRHGNGDKNTAGWGEALGSNKNWYPSSGNASRGSQGSHHHDRHSHSSELRRSSSNHSRRPDHRHDHGSGGSSRSLSRGQSQRGVCKFYENGYCRKGSTCQYLHR